MTSAISGNSCLEAINVASNNPRYHSIDGVLFNTTGLLVYPAGKKLTIYEVPSGITYIGEDAFYQADSLEKVVLPNSLVTIERSAFMSCSNLTELNLPNSISIIEEYAFTNDYCLQNIILPLSLENITKDILCSVKCVTIQENVKKIELHSYYNYLETVYFTGDAPTNVENIIAASNNRKLTIYYPSGNNTWNNIISKYSNSNITWKKHKHSSDNYLIAESGNPCTGSGTVNECCTVCGAVKQTSTQNNIGHSYNEVVVPATTDKDGSRTGICTMCHKQVLNKTIKKIKSVSLSSTTYTYSGSSKKPSVTVKDSNGKKIDKKYYTITYKDNKKVGQATVSIKFKGNYSGTIKKTFTIKPKSTSITSITAGSKSFKVKWKKQSSQTSGYEIQYSTSKKFSKKMSVIISKNKTTSKTISKLKAKKKYYVRIRTYKTIKINGKSQKIYSSWSKVKTVTTKK